VIQKIRPVVLVKLGLGLTALILISIIIIDPIKNSLKTPVAKRIRSTSSFKAPKESRKARFDYFFRMLRDPSTNSIPFDIRTKELAFAKKLQQENKALSKTAASLFTWYEAGPNDVGGRTRAFGVDSKNSNTLIAGGVSGGIWKSTDGGSNWILKSLPTQHLSVTSLAQDQRTDFSNIWYYATGEFDGNSASAQGWSAMYFGSGLYKSTDNGETWQQLQTSGNPTSWDSRYDYVSRIVVHPENGYVYISSNVGGIYRSINEGSSFELVFGDWGDHYYTDVIVTGAGDLVAALSEYPGTSNPTYSPGIYYSDNNGDTWQNITPATFPEIHERTVLASAPSNPNIVYALTNTGDLLDNDHEDIRFHWMNLSNGQSQDRSANLPDFNQDYQDFIYTQGNYNMLVAVKPDDENFVVIGATSLFRSPDGFATAPTNFYNTLIGGYIPVGTGRYPNLHPDQHIIVFDPASPNKAWCGHDGGLSLTNDITAYATSSALLSWQDKNRTYHTTQFYTIAIPDEAGRPQILGGTQDNGSPSYRWEGGTTITSSKDISSGDGAYAYFGNDYCYTSWYDGNIFRVNYTSTNDPKSPFESGTLWTVITPTDAENQLFINPFSIDPNDENVMYYPAGYEIWRNDRLSSIALYRNDTMVGWKNLTEISVPTEYIITAIQVSKSNPSHVLYYGASSDPWQNEEDVPKLYRLANANTDTSGAEDISIPEAESGSYVHQIAVNPENGNEILVLLSNYNIVGLYHSSNGGQSYTAVEGNLTGDDSNPGPSIRTATILPTDQGTVYFLGTSIGLFSTMTLNGASTSWVQEAGTSIGNCVVEHVVSRTSDHHVAVGTHGRGVFVGTYGSTGVDDKTRHPAGFVLEQNTPNPFNPSTTIRFSLPKNEHVTLKVFDTMGRETEKLIDKRMDAGNHAIRFDGSRLASGTYYCTIDAGNHRETIKMILVK
jgi:hypothetical protein